MRLICTILLAAGGLCPAFGLNPNKALTQYSNTVWTERQGLPQDTVRAIAQTTDGYLWLGTDEGLARFDGYEFVTFSKVSGQLPSNSIRALAAGSAGSLWIGTSNGLTYYKDGQFRSYLKKDGLADNSVSSLFVDHAGVLWAVAGGSLSRFEGGRFTTFLHERDLPLRNVWGVAEDVQHNFYVVGAFQVLRYENGQFVKVVGREQFPQGALPKGVLPDHAGNLWIWGVGGLIQRTPDGKLRRYGPAQGVPGNVNAFWEDRDGNLWIGYDGGLGRMEGGHFRARAAQSDGDIEPVNAMFEDREGDLWLGRGDGAERLRDDLFTVYGIAEGLPSDEPNAVYQDRSSRIWMGFPDGGPMLFSPGGMPSAKPLQGVPKGRVYGFRETRSGELLIPTSEGLIRMKGSAVTTFAPPNMQLGVKRVFDAAEDTSGRIWLALPNGLGVLDGSAYRNVIPGGPLAETQVITLAVTRDNVVWAGTNRNGLWRVSGKRERLYTTADGLGSDAIRSLYEDKNGTLWIGTLGGGLNALRHGKFFIFAAKNGLLSDNVLGIVDDGESLWLTTTRGICRVAEKQLDDFAAKRISALTPVNYGVADGLRSAQGPATAGAGGGARFSDGSLWFPMNRGVAVFDPKVPRRAQPAPQLRLLELDADGRQFALTPAPRVPPGSGRLQIRYAAIHLSAPERVEYSYKLDDIDSDWVNADARRLVNYNSLGHGSYRFEIRAALPDGPAAEAAYEFVLMPAFYETLWFRLLMALALAGIGWAIYKLRERQVRARFAVVLEERARLAREVHDTLAQGFVGIASQLEVVDMRLPKNATEARESLTIARGMARHSLTEARRSVMDLRSAALDNQDLAAALASGAKDWTAGSDVKVDFDVTGEVAQLPEEVAHHILRIAQEGVTNVLKHSGANRIALRLNIDGKKLKLRVEDNGKGFEDGETFASNNGHFGLIGMRERAERLGGELKLDSHPGTGTQLEVTVPLACHPN